MCLLIFPKHCVGNVHHDNFQRGRAGAGWAVEAREPLFLWPALGDVRTGPESFTDGGGRSTYSLVFVSGGCVLFIDAGTRVHLLDAKGLSFTQNVFICVCYCLQYIWIWRQHSKIRGPVVSRNCSCLFWAHCILWAHLNSFSILI